MSALANYLRAQVKDRLARLPPEERIDLALSLGEADVRMFCAANDEQVEAARLRLRANRQIGRRPSVASIAPHR